MAPLLEPVPIVFGALGRVEQPVVLGAQVGIPGLVRAGHPEVDVISTEHGQVVAEWVSGVGADSRTWPT